MSTEDIGSTSLVVQCDNCGVVLGSWHDCYCSSMNASWVAFESCALESCSKQEIVSGSEAWVQRCMRCFDSRHGALVLQGAELFVAATPCNPRHSNVMAALCMEYFLSCGSNMVWFQRCKEPAHVWSRLLGSQFVQGWWACQEGIQVGDWIAVAIHTTLFIPQSGRRSGGKYTVA